VILDFIAQRTIYDPHKHNCLPGSGERNRSDSLDLGSESARGELLAGVFAQVKNPNDGKKI